ncbi:MAG TPA: hypothetical protein VGJ17_04720, partial [Candidatus Limnocylindrales bacterium]
MADYVWWFLIVGVVVGGVLVAAISMDNSRREEDIAGEEREAEATLLAAQLSADGLIVDREIVAEVLDAHREYRRLPPPDGFEPVAEPDPEPAAKPDREPAAEPDSDELALAGLVRARAESAADRHPDGKPDEVGDGR